MNTFYFLCLPRPGTDGEAVPGGGCPDPDAIPWAGLSLLLLQPPRTVPTSDLPPIPGLMPGSGGLSFNEECS